MTQLFLWSLSSTKSVAKGNVFVKQNYAFGNKKNLSTLKGGGQQSSTQIQPRLEMGYLKFALAVFFSCEGTIGLKVVPCSNYLSLSNTRLLPSSFPDILTSTLYSDMQYFGYLSMTFGFPQLYG